MKTILLCTALTFGAYTLHAQNAPNREGVGDVPNAVPPMPGNPSTPRPDGKPADANRPEGPHEASAKNADERFVRKAGKAGKMEVKVAEQGVAKASREDLKAFSTMLVKDHTAANMELAAIAKSMGVEIPEPHAKDHEESAHAKPGNDPSGRKPTGEKSGDGEKSAELEKHRVLKEKSGMEFDRAFMEIMEDCHAKDIALFEKAQGAVKSLELKAFISKTLPVLKKHAKALADLNHKDPNRTDGKTPTSSPGGTPNPTLPGGTNPTTPDR